jgi:hypothetical protein
LADTKLAINDMKQKIVDKETEYDTLKAKHNKERTAEKESDAAEAE